jgi:proline iminopeptidase
MIKKFLLYFCLFVSTINAQEAITNPYVKEGFVSVKNAKLFYRTAGKGPPLIVLHGGPGLDQNYLLPQLYELAENNLVIFYDQRGSGKSLETELDEKHIHIHQFVEDLEALRLSFGFDKFILMGHSWGGLLAMQYAVDHPENLMGLILLNTAPADYKGQKAFVDELGLRIQRIYNDIKPLFAYEDFKHLNANQISDLYRKLFSVYFYNSEEENDLSLNFSVASAQSGFKVMEEMSKTSWLQPSLNLFPSLKELAVPTFILHGKQDIVPVWASEEIKDAIPRAEMVILDRCGHFPYIEQSSQFFSELNKFLRKINHEPRSRLKI